MDEDRVKGAAQNIGGKVKEAAGKLTGDRQMQAEGKADQVKGDVKNAAGKAAGAVKGAVDKARS